eukprot:8005495-Prorocentrum_lima.AAC.1
MEEPESHDQEMMQQAFIQGLAGQSENAIVSLATHQGNLFKVLPVATQGWTDVEQDHLRQRSVLHPVPGKEQPP